MHMYNKYKNNIQEEAFIDNLQDEVNLEIGFDWSLLKRDELYVNLIHFDLNISNKENYGYYNKFKVDVVGGYLAVDNLSMLILYLEEIKKKNLKINREIPFIALSSGFSGKDVIPIFKRYAFVKEVIIFCGNYNKYQVYLSQYPGYVKKIFTDISQVYNYIKSFGVGYSQGTKDYQKSDDSIFSLENIQMNKQLEQCPVISAYEYDNCYFLVHKAYAHFFRTGLNNVIFTRYYFEKIQKYIYESEIIESKDKQGLIDKFYSLVDQENFVELSIRKYTGESTFCYVFNRTMRNFEKGLISLAYYMGPFLFAVNKYVKENPQYGFNKNMTLHRNIICSIFDYYLYKINLGHIICFPSITSTSLVPKEFESSGQNKGFQPTALGQKVNKHEGNSKNLLKIRMIFNYYHKPGNISPGIIVTDKKGKDGDYLSKNPNEKEVILFPFTFARITGIKRVSQTENKFEISFDIINRNKYLEDTLRDNVQNRYRFSYLDQQYNK